jgi:hypothetical protein
MGAAEHVGRHDLPRSSRLSSRHPPPHLPRRRHPGREAATTPKILFAGSSEGSQKKRAHADEWAEEASTSRKSVPAIFVPVVATRVSCNRVGEFLRGGACPVSTMKIPKNTYIILKTAWRFESGSRLLMKSSPTHTNPTNEPTQPTNQPTNQPPQ